MNRSHLSFVSSLCPEVRRMVEAKDVHQHRDGSDKRGNSQGESVPERLRQESHQEGLGSLRVQQSTATSADLQEKGVVGTLSLHDDSKDGKVHDSGSRSAPADKHDRAGAAEQPAASDKSDKKSSDPGPLPGIKVENHGASDKFVQNAQHVMEDAFSRLTPEAQKSMAGLKVSIQKNESRDAQPGTPAFYNDRGDTVHLFQRSSEQMKAQNRNPEDIVKHELGHPLDVHNGNFSQSPEFKQEFDKAVKSLPPHLRKQIEAGIRTLGPEQARAEVFADLAAVNYGANPNTLGYLPPDFVPAFKGAQELIHKRFFK
jgi:hypothetical protein